MTDMIDPRTMGFNYGAGWGGDPKPPLYYLATTLCRELRTKAAFMSARAWELEMAIRDVRIASLGSEKALAVKRLEAKLEELGQEA